VQQKALAYAQTKGDKHMPGIFDQDLGRNDANYAPLSPLSFIERAAEVYPQRTAIIHGPLRRTWA
jgi:fatty-acyl-CoA synthase